MDWRGAVDESSPEAVTASVYRRIYAYPGYNELTLLVPKTVCFGTLDHYYSCWHIDSSGLLIFYSWDARAIFQQPPAIS